MALKPVIAGFVQVPSGGGSQLTADELAAIQAADAPDASNPFTTVSGAKQIAVDEFAAPTDVTTNDSSTVAHGFLAKLNGDPSYYMAGDGQWRLNISPSGTNLSNTPDATNVGLESSTGSGTTILAATTSVAGVMSAADKTKLNSLDTVIFITSPVVNDDVSANTLIDTGLEFALISGVRYEFHFFVPYDAAINTTGSRWVLDGPAFSQLNFRSMYTLTATAQTLNFGATYNFPASCGASSLTTGNVAMIDGFLTPSADGTLKLRFASEVSGSAITALAGASGRIATR